MDMDSELPIPSSEDEHTGVLPEIEIFCYLLIIMFLVDKSMFVEVRGFPGSPHCHLVSYFLQTYIRTYLLSIHAGP